MRGKKGDKKRRRKVKEHRLKRVRNKKKMSKNI
jgi:hypothetical protein